MPATHLCLLLSGFSWELHSTDYSWGISIKSPRVYFINSGAIPRKQLLKSATRGNLKSHSKVRSVRQLKVDSSRIFACFDGILRVKASMEPSCKRPSGPGDDGT
jgi:hypothetical protein